MYSGEKHINRFYKLGNTYFLDPQELNIVKAKLKKNNYSVFYPYKDSEKCIIYRDNIPKVLLYEIKCNIEIRHQDILGAMYSLDISKDLFGDILIINGHYYIYLMPLVRNYFEANFLMVKNARVKIEETSLELLKDYKRKYLKLELITSSNRIDTVIASICHIGRSNITSLIKKREIIINYSYLINCDYKLHEGDVFSVKKHGKFKYVGIIKTTKKKHYLLSIWQYL